MHELDDLVFASELRQCVLLFTFLKVLQSWEARDLEAISHGLVHRGVHCCQHAWTLWGEHRATPEVVRFGKIRTLEQSAQARTLIINHT